MSQTLSTDRKKAVLVGIHLQRITSEEFESSMQELERLVNTLGYHVVGRVSQKRSTDKSPNVLGDGKLRELAKWTGGSGVAASLVDRKISKAALKWKQNEDDAKGVDPTDDSAEPDINSEEDEDVAITEQADIVIVDTDLSPSQLRNLESAAGVPILDRTGVIIEIFSRHARTRAARLQVEIARLTYVAPRLRESSSGGDRQGGGVGGKGSGETSLELDKRKIRDRIKELKTELGAIGNEHAVRRTRRGSEISVALVGYTNAGKSSLMRALTGSEVLVADKLFATLDTTVRPLYPESQPKVLISDTVGFIKKLPHDLVASFKSTLDEAAHASLLLYVVDCADSSFRSQLDVTQKVLAEVGAQSLPHFLVLNKRDKINQDEQEKLLKEFPSAILISTRDKGDLSRLRDKILGFFESDMIDSDLFIPYVAKGIVGDVRARARVLGESYTDTGVTLRLRTTSEMLSQFEEKIKKSSHE